MDPVDKPAWLTTEFWLSVITAGVLLIGMFTGKDTSGVDVPSLATAALGVVTAGYALARAITKVAKILGKSRIEVQKLAIQHAVQADAAAFSREQAMRTAPDPDPRLSGQVISLQRRVSELELAQPRKVVVPTKKAAPRKTASRARR